MKTISDIIRNNTEPDIEDSRMLCYTESEVRNMIYEASSLAYQTAMYENTFIDVKAKSVTQFLAEISNDQPFNIALERSIKESKERQEREEKILKSESNNESKEPIQQKLNLPQVIGRSEQLICPACDNPYCHSHTDGSYSCEDCGHKWAN